MDYAHVIVCRKAYQHGLNKPKLPYNFSFRKQDKDQTYKCAKFENILELLDGINSQKAQVFTK